MNTTITGQTSKQVWRDYPPPPPAPSPLLIPGKNADVFVTIYPNIGLTNMVDLKELINYKDVSSFFSFSEITGFNHRVCRKQTVTVTG